MTTTHTTRCSPFASLPWDKLAAAKTTAATAAAATTAAATNTTNSTYSTTADLAFHGVEFSQAQSNELYAMLTGSGAPASGGDTPVLPTMSPLLSKTLDVLASSSLLPLMPPPPAQVLDFGLRFDGYDGCGGYDGDMLSPSLERLIHQLQNDSGHSAAPTTAAHVRAAPMRPAAAKIGKATPTTTCGAAGKAKAKRKNKHDPRGPTQHVLDAKLRSMFTAEQLHLPSDDFKALVAQMRLTSDEDKRVKQLRRRIKCVEYSRANRLKNRRKREQAGTATTHAAVAGGAGAGAGAGTASSIHHQTLADENQRLHEELTALHDRITHIEHDVNTTTPADGNFDYTN